MSLTPAALQTFARALAAAPERWRQHIRHDQRERVYSLIWEDDEVNAWVICWSHEQDTGFHDHDHSAAAITVIEGEILEERLRLNGPPAAARHAAGATFTLPPTAIHRVQHAGEGLAISIHAYSPPLTRTGAYRVSPDGALEREPLDAEAELTAAPRERAAARPQLTAAPRLAADEPEPRIA